MAEQNERIQIRTRFDGQWVGGYEVIERDERPGGRDVLVRVRRRSDGRVLPERFGAEEVRPDR